MAALLNCMSSVAAAALLLPFIIISKDYDDGRERKQKECNRKILPLMSGVYYFNAGDILSSYLMKYISEEQDIHIQCRFINISYSYLKKTKYLKI